MQVVTVPPRPTAASSDAGVMSPWARDPARHDNPWGLSAAIALLVAITFLALIGVDYLDFADLAMLYLVAIMLAALISRVLALAAVVLAVTILDFAIVYPRFAFGISDAHTFATLSILIGAGLAIGAQTNVLRRNERVARDHEHRTAAMLAFTRDIATAADIPEIARITVHHVEDIAGARAVVLVHSDHSLAPAAGGLALSEPELEVARWSLVQGLPAGHSTTTLPRTGVTALPLRVADEVHGVLVVGQTRAPGDFDLEQRILLDALARQAGSAIARARLVALAREATLRARTEELRSSLLSAVSHDLRTPLAVITGAATTLRDDAASVSPAVGAELLDTIVTEAARLERVLQNLLAITRVETGLQPAREWIPVEELCGAALERLRSVIGERRVDIDIPSDLQVPVDPVLFEHVLINLVENAVKYGAPPIVIAARADGEHVDLYVRDHGAGIPSGYAERMFEKFSRAPGTRVPGVGLGLAVVRGIVEAHAGTITAADADGGGARFHVRLPAAGAPPPASPEDP